MNAQQTQNKNYAFKFQIQDTFLLVTHSIGKVKVVTWNIYCKNNCLFLRTCSQKQLTLCESFFNFKYPLLHNSSALDDVHMSFLTGNSMRNRCVK